MPAKIEKRIWGISEDGEFEFVTITENLFEQALNIIRVDFIHDESVCSSLKIKDSQVAVEEIVYLNRVALAEGVSICAVERKTGNVAAIQINKMQIKPKTNEKGFFCDFLEKDCKDDRSGGLLYFMLNVDSQVDLFGKYNANCIMELMSLATKREYRQKNLALGVTKYSVALAEAQARGALVSPKFTDKIDAISVIYTAIYSQKLGIKLNFDELLRGNNEFTYKNVTYRPEKDYQQTYILFGKKIL